MKMQKLANETLPYCALFDSRPSAEGFLHALKARGIYCRLLLRLITRQDFLKKTTIDAWSPRDFYFELQMKFSFKKIIGKYFICLKIFVCSVKQSLKSNKTQISFQQLIIYQ